VCISELCPAPALFCPDGSFMVWVSEVGLSWEGVACQTSHYMLDRENWNSGYLTLNPLKKAFPQLIGKGSAPRSEDMA
jgi:hypothetical protein